MSGKKSRWNDRRINSKSMVTSGRKGSKNSMQLRIGKRTVNASNSDKRRPFRGSAFKQARAKLWVTGSLESPRARWFSMSWTSEGGSSNSITSSARRTCRKSIKPCSSTALRKRTIVKTSLCRARRRIKRRGSAWTMRSKSGCKTRRGLLQMPSHRSRMKNLWNSARRIWKTPNLLNQLISIIDR